MKYEFVFTVGVAFFLLIAVSSNAFAAGLIDQVPQAFTKVYGRAPTASEKTYWNGRVTSKEKKTYNELVGAMYYAKAHPTTTSTAKKTDDKATMIKSVLPLFIQIYAKNPTESEKAWWRKRISCNEIKTTKDLVSSMNFHKSKGVRKGSDTICGASASGTSSASGVSKRGIAGLSNHAMGDEVRIGIFKTDGKAIHVTSNGEYQIREGKSKILGKVGKDDVVQVSWSDGKYHVRGSGVEFDTEQEIRLVPLNQAIMQIKNYSDPSKTYPGKNYNRFRGVIEIRKCDGCSELWAINELRVEYYLRGLAETSGTGPAEYLKTLGIAARTYVLYHKIVTGGRQPKKGYDIDNTPNDQIYRGYEYEIITSNMSSVFNSVKGVVVANGEGDKLVAAVYFSDSDGRTRSAQEKWNSSRFPHLQSVDDPRHASSSCKGHCVGLSAQGAFGLASKDNWNFQKILKHFYKGVALVKAY